MYKNIYFAISLIVFCFLFMGYTYRVMKKEFKLEEVENMEIWACSVMTSTLLSFLTYGFAIGNLQTLYDNSLIAFWFVFFSISNTFLRVTCFSVKTLNKITKKWLSE